MCGTPHMTILSFASSNEKLSIFAIADIMEEKGDWLPTASYYSDCT